MIVVCNHNETRHTRIATGGQHMTAEGPVENSRLAIVCATCGKEVDDD
jgi:hypothetical protein